MVYVAHGPFTNGIAPAIDQTFCNDIDNCLTGNLGFAKVLLATGSITRIAFGQKTVTSGAANTTTHGFGVLPTAILVVPVGSALSPGAIGLQVGDSGSLTTTTFEIHSNTNITVNWLAIA
jgi:hypothetical protein